MADSVLTVPAPRPSREEVDQRRRAAMRVIRSFRDGDAAEQRETGEFLLRALDEDRPAARKLFARL